MSKEKDGRDIILRDRYRDIIAGYLGEIDILLAEVKAGQWGQIARLAQVVQDLDRLRNQLLKLEGKLSYDNAKPIEGAQGAKIDIDKLRDKIGRRLDHIRRSAQADGICE